MIFMRKINDKGFMLAETLIVTTFVAGVLVFLFIQFSKLSNSYNYYYDYNSTENLYALEDIKNYIESDSNVSSIPGLIEDTGYVEITDCTIFTDTDYCLKLFELENVNKIYIIHNSIFNSKLDMEDKDALTFLKNIKSSDNKIYKLVCNFEDGSYSSLNLEGIPDINN